MSQPPAVQAPVAAPASDLPVAPAFPVGAAYTAPCRECGARLYLTEDELAASLDRAPVCWPCERNGEDGVDTTG